MTPLKLSRGKCLPLGATQLNNSINFALLCRHGTEVHLALFTLDSKEPIAEIVLHQEKAEQEIIGISLLKAYQNLSAMGGESTGHNLRFTDSIPNTCF